MTLIVTEGLSCSGKSTTMAAADLDGVPVVVNKGMNDVGKEQWDSYQWNVLEHCGQVYQQNPDCLFIHDRLFTEAVYSEDPDQRNKFRRAIQGLPDVTVVYFEAPKTVLEKRNSQDLWRYDELRQRYERLLDAVRNVERIDTGARTVDDAAAEFETIVEEAHNGC